MISTEARSTRDGALVPVRAKTFALLAHLAANAGRVLGKAALLDAVWPDVTVTEDSLTQAVRDLRRAIGDERGEVVRTIAAPRLSLRASRSPTRSCPAA